MRDHRTLNVLTLLMLISQAIAHFLIMMPFQASRETNHLLSRPHIFLSVPHHMTFIMAVFHHPLEKSNHLLSRPRIFLSAPHHMRPVMMVFHPPLEEENRPLNFLIGTLKPLIPTLVLNLIRMGTILWNDYCHTDVFVTLNSVNTSYVGRDIHLSVIHGSHRLI